MKKLARIAAWGEAICHLGAVVCMGYLLGLSAFALTLRLLQRPDPELSAYAVIILLSAAWLALFGWSSLKSARRALQQEPKP